MGRLDGKVAIVTGAGQGVGRGIAIALAKEGAAVVLAGRTLEKVEHVAAELSTASMTARAVRCDVGVRADVMTTIETAVDTFGRLDIVVNNAAGGYEQYLIEETTDEYLRGAVDTNIMGTFFFMQAALPHLKQTRGNIINLASGAGTEGWARLMSYAATKEAIRAMTRVASKEWGQYGINVNVIAPLANSPGMEWFQDEQPQHFGALMAATPLGYLGDCEGDIGPVAVFLACDDSKYITGHTFMVDGGLFVLR